MTDTELVKVLLDMRGFHAPEGVESALVVQPKPGVCQVTVELHAGREWRSYRITTPPSEEGWRALYREALDVLAASSKDEANGNAGNAGSIPYRAIGIDLAAIGGE